jgi:hypothetical protein
MIFIFIFINQFLVNAYIPVIALPIIKAWISFVPSYVLTVYKFIACLKTWYYSAIPLPPIIYLASRAICIDFIQLFLFIIDICSTANSPFSLRRDTCRTPKSPKEISTYISASFFCINWKEANGTPNCFRSKTYFLAWWKQN